jgi:hypothetical protein
MTEALVLEMKEIKGPLKHHWTIRIRCQVSLVLDQMFVTDCCYQTSTLSLKTEEKNPQETCF